MVIKIEDALENAENALKELRQALIAENLLVQDPESEEESLVTNQDPRAREEYEARKLLDIRF